MPMEGTAKQIIEWLLDQPKDVLFKITLIKKKRSLDANAYAWVLCQKIAEVLQTSKDEVYERMIQRYSTFDMDEGGYITVTMLQRVPVEKLGGHWRMIGTHDGFNSYIRLKGSSEMDPKEMNHLITGIVSEAQELGIETMTPRELQRMEELYAKHYYKRP